MSSRSVVKASVMTYIATRIFWLASDLLFPSSSSPSASTSLLASHLRTRPPRLAPSCVAVLPASSRSQSGLSPVRLPGGPPAAPGVLFVRVPALTPLYQDLLERTTGFEPATLTLAR